MEAEDEKAMSEAEKVKQWHERITKAEKEYEPFHDLIKETREYYKNESKKTSIAFLGFRRDDEAFFIFQAAAALCGP